VSAALTEVVESSAGRGRRGTVKLVVGGAIVACYLVAALFPGLLAGPDPLHQDLLHRLAARSAAPPLGTDALGRDVGSRLVHGTRVDLRVGVLCAVLPMLIGTVLGALSGFYGGLLDLVVGRLIELVQSFPVLVFFLAVLPQFVVPTQPLLPQYLAVGVTMVAVDLVVMGFYTGLSVRLLKWLHTPRKQTVMNRVFSGLFAGAAVVLSLVRRGPITA